MKVKLLTSMATADHAWAPGEVVEVDAATGKRMVDGGLAVEEKAPRKTATAKRQRETR